MKLNGKEYAFSIMKVADAEKFSAAMALLNKAKEIPKPTGVEDFPGWLREQCGICISFFDTIFGEGAGAQIIPDTEDLSVCRKSIAEFLQLTNEQRKEDTASMHDAVTAAVSSAASAPAGTPPMRVASNGGKNKKKHRHHGKHPH